VEGENIVSFHQFFSFYSKLSPRAVPYLLFFCLAPAVYEPPAGFYARVGDFYELRRDSYARRRKLYERLAGGSGRREKQGKPTAVFEAGQTKAR
jgi:hypothetical protein